MVYHVSVYGNDKWAGTEQAPFRTINRAAALAAPGDTVLVHSGQYREWVDPQYGGTDEHNRITYQAAPGEHPVIKGSEIVTDWELVEGTVWKKTLPNSLFGDWNPFAQVVWGDWMCLPQDYDVHYGDVYINGVSMFEASSMEDLYKAEPRHEFMPAIVGHGPEYVLHPEQSVYRYLPQVDEESTTLLCNFQDVDPNRELIEVSVRKCCFYPKRTGVDYITLNGFEISHAACPWAPPTAEQFGMVGPHWSLGWIIENNHLHDAKCSAISLGKRFSHGDNFSSRFNRKSGHRYQLEDVIWELEQGWSRETVGSHVVRNNVIHDCGQNGIVGHMGCAFSTIEHNHIYNIVAKREFWGHELGGIKLHAAIDVVIRDNNIHHCTKGLWLDWQAQGARVTGNLFYENHMDLFFEVTHGPLTIDQNILLSDQALYDTAQGTAMVHNLVAGRVRPRTVLNRDTPYHRPHSTRMKGFCPMLGGDDRFYNNMYLGVAEQIADMPLINGCFGSSYDHYSTPEEYETALKQGRPFSQPTYTKTMQPIWSSSNAYAGNAKPFRGENDAILAQGLCAELTQQGDSWVLTLDIPRSVLQADGPAVNTAMLGKPRLSDAPFENPDGSPLDFSVDAGGEAREGAILPGPFAKLREGKQQRLVWQA